MRKLWLLFWALLGLTFALTGGVVWWALNPTSAYIVVSGIQVTQDERGDWYVTSGRQLPYGDVVADWRIQITVLRPELSYGCQMEGRTDYLASAGPVVRYPLGEWADACLDAGPPVSIRFTRSARVFYGLIPLRPLTYDVLLDTESAPVTHTVE